VFAASGLLPSSNDVLFCTEKTPLTIIEAFIMRAVLFDSKMKNLKSNVQPRDPELSRMPGYHDKVFFIANFQKLNLQMQNEVYDFMKRQEILHSKTPFSLYVFSVGLDTRNVNLIEEIRN
jgi:CRISPR/Cas system endoribonuclease Cas6 (RAMP superfamily)